MRCVGAGFFLLACTILVIVICCVFVRGANKSNRHVSNRNVYVPSGPATTQTPVSSSKQYKNSYPLQPTTASAPPQPVAYPPPPYPTDPTLSKQAPPPVSSSKQYKNAYPFQPTTVSAPPQPVAYPPPPYPTDPTLSKQAPPPYNPDGYKVVMFIHEDISCVYSGIRRTKYMI